MASFQDFFESNLLYVYLAQGLAFFLMACVVALEAVRPSRVLSVGNLWLLVGFGLTNSFLEWTGLAILIRFGSFEAASPAYLALRTVLIGISFFLLFLFGSGMVSNFRRNVYLFYPVPLTAFVLWALPTFLIASQVIVVHDHWTLIGEVIARYTLALPGALITGGLLMYRGRGYSEAGQTVAGSDLKRAGLALIAYAIAAGLIVPMADYFPASFINANTFSELTGVPVQVLRALFAFSVAFFLGRVFVVDVRGTLTKANRQLANLNESLKLINQSLDLDLVLRQITEKACELTGADTSALMLADAGELRLKASQGGGSPEFWPEKANGESIQSAVVRAGEVFTVNDLDHHLEIADKCPPGARALLCVPIKHQDESIGVLTVCHRRLRRTFDKEDVGVITLLAGQAAVAIQNAKLFDEVTQRARDLATLNHVGAALNESLDLHALLDRALRELMELTGMEGGGIHIVDEDAKDLRLVVSSGLSQEHARAIDRFEMGEGIAGQVAATGEPLTVEDIATDERLTRRDRSVMAFRTLMSIPLKAEGRTLGVLGLTSKGSANLSKERLSLLTALGTQIGMAIRNASLFRDQEKSAAEAAVLYQISTEISALADLDEVLTHIVEEARQLLGTDSALLALIEEDQNEIYMRTTSGVTTEALANIRLPMGTGLAWLVIESNEPMTVVNFFDDPRLRGAPAEAVAKEGLVSFIAVPMSLGGRNIGVLYVANRRVTNFTSKETTLLSSLANQAAIALENASLYHELDSEKKKLDAILDGMGDGVSILDSNRRLVYSNQALHRLFGNRLIGKYCYEVFLRRDRPCVECPVSRAMQTGEVVREIHEAVRVDGSPGFLDITVTPLAQERRESGLTVTVARDVTEEKELERLKDDFVATASHEFRTPLAIIKGFSQMLVKKEMLGIEGEQEEQLLRQIDDEVTHLSELVEGLLDASRIEAGRTDADARAVSLPGVVEKVVDGLLLRAENRQIGIVMKNGFEPTALADESLVEQILVNLVSNAIKYSPNGSRIEVNLETTDQMVVVSVKDEGVGIPAEQQSLLFRRFSRIPNPRSTIAGGTGLGLYITKGLVEAQGGSIWVESSATKGSTFFFTLPLAESRVR